MAGLQHVRQQLLAERAAIDRALAEAGESSKVQVAFVAEHRFRALGGMDLLKRARQIERDRTLKQGLPPHPNLRLVTYQRWERRREVQRQMVLRTMAQATVRTTDLVRQAVNLPPISLAGPEGHWQMTKAVLQMRPRQRYDAQATAVHRPPIGENELELAAAEIGVALEKQPHLLWLVLAYMRAPVPCGWVEVDSTAKSAYERMSSELREMMPAGFPLAAAAPPAAAPAAAADPADVNRLSTIYDDVPTEQASAGAGQPAIYRHTATGERPVF